MIHLATSPAPRTVILGPDPRISGRLARGGWNDPPMPFAGDGGVGGMPARAATCGSREAGADDRGRNREGRL
ncbi:hypothetical protein OB2597_15240 [Pseudooceanicola batsensis HTCC2597]|uniref:Uncharacterized protein n=1 Tax=Pseudooceanicola batsensis (strain ATCC BAA-863 / DSM 15984 / KCTC 12145 / HTCC2597) TaxID=252305 RepID=A3TYT0_PSEBH|nr:hypothetical protein OB2597_15240 [Pseudooceanicola batsensis HTCC2597]